MGMDDSEVCVVRHRSRGTAVVHMVSVIIAHGLLLLILFHKASASPPSFADVFTLQRTFHLVKSQKAGQS